MADVLGGILVQEHLADVDGDAPRQWLIKLRGQCGYSLVIAQAVAYGVDRPLKE